MKLYVLILLGLCLTKADHEVDVRMATSLFANDISKLLTEDSKNMLFSPFSAHSVLTMLYQGAGGTTKEALAKALHLPEPTQAAQGYEGVNAQLKGDGDQITVSLANRIYVSTGRTLRPQFSDMLKTHFSAEVQNIEFGKNAAATKEINSWVEGQTNDKIHDLLSADDVDVDTRMVLVNTLYFKGQWLNAFDEDATDNEDFFVDAQTKVQVPMMYTTGRFNYEKNDEFGVELVELPFRNSNYSMWILLPTEKYAVNRLLKDISEKDNSKMGRAAALTHMDLSLPKFKLSTTVDMQDLLEKLGLSELFSSSQCDLTNMFTNKEDIYITKAVQKTFLNVNEQGCEAASASGAVGAARSLPLLSVNVDHPFLIAITHKVTEGLEDFLLMGKIVNPAEN